MTTTYVTPDEAGVKVGDFFYGSWGYDQTNVNYFRVVGLTPKCVKIQEVYSTTVKDSGSATYVVPTDKPAVQTHSQFNYETGEFEEVVVSTPKVMTKRLQTWGNGVYLAWKSYASLTKWDGTPKYETGFGWGH